MYASDDSDDDLLKDADFTANDVSNKTSDDAHKDNVVSQNGNSKSAVSGKPADLVIDEDGMKNAYANQGGKAGNDMERKYSNRDELEKGDDGEKIGEIQANSDENSEPLDEKKIAKMTEYEPAGIVQDSRVLLEASRSRNPTLVSQILQKCPHLKTDLPDEVGKTVLHYLCTNNSNTEDIRSCLQTGSDVNLTDKMGWTALHYASMRGHRDVVEVLVGMGANCNVQDTESLRTPLHIAVSRNHTNIVNLLLLSGADPTMKDKDGKSVSDVSKNAGMSDLIEDAVEGYEKQNSRNSEKMQIEPNKLTPFLCFGITIKHVVEADRSELDKQQPFTMRIFRSNDVADLEKYGVRESEELVSDEFIIKLRGTGNKREIIVDLGFELSFGASPREELVLKTNNMHEILVNVVKEESDKYRGTVSVDIRSFTSFIVVTRPRLEKFEVGDKASNLKSALDENVELDIQSGTFNKKVTISMGITDPPPQEQLVKVLDECPEVSSTSAFYSLEADNTRFTKPIAVKVPLPLNYTGEGSLFILSMDKPPEEEKPEHWRPIDTEATVVNGRIEFEVSSFSIKCAVETPRSISRQSSTMSASMFGSQTSLLVQVSQVLSKVYRKARRKEYKVKFFCVTRRQGMSNTFTVITECCLEDNVTSRISFWEGDGFKLQGHSREIEKNVPITVNAKEKFTLKIKDTEFQGHTNANHLIEFHPKRQNNYSEYTLKISDKIKFTSVNTGVFRVVRTQTNDENNIENDSVDEVAFIEVVLHRFHPDMLKELDGKSFLTYNRMIDIQEEIGDKWWKVLVLLDIPFVKVEQTMQGFERETKEKINEMLFDWRQSRCGDRSRGVPDLLSALSRSNKGGLVHRLRRQLVKWKDEPQNRTDGFYAWLENAYIYNLILPTKRTKPMSDQFLAMVADMLKPSAKLVENLGLDKKLGKEILDNDRMYPMPEIKTMKILTILRASMSDLKTQLIKLLQVLKEQNLTEIREYVIMWIQAWIDSPKEKQSDHDDEKELRQLLKELKT